MKHTEHVYDMFNGTKIPSYPIKYPKFKFDLIFTKNDRWIYVNSSNTIERFEGCIKSVVDKGERFRVIDVGTGEIVAYE